MIVVPAANFLISTIDHEGMATFLDKVELPCVTVGLGAQSASYRTRVPLKRGTERLVRILAERTEVLGVRGDFTASVLDDLGIHNYEVTGCPSFFLRGDLGLNVKPAPSGDETPYRYSINGSRDVIGHAFDPKAMEAVVRGLVAEAVIADAPFVVQSEWEELCIADRASGYWWKPLRLLMQAYHGMLPRRDLRRWLLERMTVYWSVEEWLDAMREVDCVIGTRLHGSIAALLAGPRASSSSTTRGPKRWPATSRSPAYGSTRSGRCASTSWRRWPTPLLP